MCTSGCNLCLGCTGTHRAHHSFHPEVSHEPSWTKTQPNLSLNFPKVSFLCCLQNRARKLMKCHLTNLIFACSQMQGAAVGAAACQEGSEWCTPSRGSSPQLQGSQEASAGHSSLLHCWGDTHQGTEHREGHTSQQRLEMITSMKVVYTER